MKETRYVVGIDISTQTVRVMLIGVLERNDRPSELIISREWTESRPCRDEAGRKNPAVWVDLVRQCITWLIAKAPETALAEAVGVSTTFPGCFVIGRDGAVNSRFASLYDNTDDAGVCSGAFEDALGFAELDTLNRMWPGNMAIGAAAMVRSGLDLSSTAKLVPLNTAFSCELLRTAGCRPAPEELFSDFTQTSIGGLYGATSGDPVPPGVRALVERAMPSIHPDHLRSLLPPAVPCWRNIIPRDCLPAMRQLLGLPNLISISIGAGDSPLGMLALMPDRQTVTTVRGSTDSPMIVVDTPKPTTQPRETVLHYPMPTATSLDNSPWCVVAPTLRSGRVWDWVRELRYPSGAPGADAELEALALESYRASARPGSPPVPHFDVRLGGERAPSWDAAATGSITGLVESHGIGDIALAALEGVSHTLRDCIELMESRYGVRGTRLLLLGGPAQNKLWNWITQVRTGKSTYATTFSDASLLGAALLGYGALYDGREPDESVSLRLQAVSGLSSSHPLVGPLPIDPLDSP